MNAIPEGEYDKAIADYTEAIRLDPKNALAYFDRGTVYQNKGDHDKAIADFTEAIRLDPKYANAWVVYQYKGDYDKAIADFTEAIRLNPTDADSYVNRALAYDQKGEPHKAKADRHEVRRLNPTWLASVLFRLFGVTANVVISLVLIAGSTVAFLAFSISLTNTSSVSDLVGSIVAAVTFVAAARAPRLRRFDGVYGHVCFVLLSDRARVWFHLSG